MADIRPSEGVPDPRMKYEEDPCTMGMFFVKMDGSVFRLLTHTSRHFILESRPPGSNILAGVNR